MNAQDVNNLTYELEHKTLFESPFSHIASWLDPRLKKQITAIENGAGGIRPVGRLAFFHNYQKIQEAIEAAERRTSGHESFMFSGKVNGQSFLQQQTRFWTCPAFLCHKLITYIHITIHS